MAEQYLIDINVIIDYLSGKYENSVLDWLDIQFEQGVNISVINRIEGLAFYFTDAEEHRLMHEFIAGSAVLPLNDSVADKTIQVRLANKVKLPDAIIAATALVFNMTLLTRNTSDFNKIINLKVLNPATIHSQS
jgi:predicted nucleic acid-binding protein